MPNREIRFTDGTSSAGDQATRSSHPAEKQRSFDARDPYGYESHVSGKGDHDPLLRKDYDKTAEGHEDQFQERTRSGEYNSRGEYNKSHRLWEGYLEGKINPYAAIGEEAPSRIKKIEKQRRSQIKTFARHYLGNIGEQFDNAPIRVNMRSQPMDNEDFAFFENHVWEKYRHYYPDEHIQDCIEQAEANYKKN